MKVSRLLRLAIRMKTPPWVLAVAKRGKEFVGPNGNAAVAYEYIGTVEVQDGPNGKTVAVRIPDWDNANECYYCHRKIVHVYYIKLGDGSVMPFGADHVHYALGFPAELNESKHKLIKSKIMVKDPATGKVQRGKSGSKRIDKIIQEFSSDNPLDFRNGKVPGLPKGWPSELAFKLKADPYTLDDRVIICSKLTSSDQKNLEKLGWQKTPYLELNILLKWELLSRIDYYVEAFEYLTKRELDLKYNEEHKNLPKGKPIYYVKDKSIVGQLIVRFDSFPYYPEVTEPYLNKKGYKPASSST